MMDVVKVRRQDCSVIVDRVLTFSSSGKWSHVEERLWLHHSSCCVLISNSGKTAKQVKKLLGAGIAQLVVLGLAVHSVAGSILYWGHFR